MNSGTSNHRTQTAQERKQEYDANQSLWKELKKMKERYPALKSRLEVCREARPLSISTVKDQQALQYFQTCQEQIQKKLDDVEQTVLRHKERYERELKALEKSLEYHLHVEDLRKAKLQDSMSFIQTRLTTAQERVTAGKERKTKEELSLEKEIREYYVRYRTLFPSAPDLLDVFPGISDLVDVSGNIPPTPSEVAPLPPIQPPVSEEPPKPRGKRGVKKTDDQIPSAPLPPPVSEEVPEEKPVEEEPEVKEEVKEEPKEEKKFLPLARSVSRPQTPLDVHPAARLSVQQVNSMSQAELFAYMNPGKRNPLAQPKILTSTKRPTH